MVQLLRHRTTVVADTKCKKNVFLIQICIASKKLYFWQQRSENLYSHSNKLQLVVCARQYALKRDELKAICHFVDERGSDWKMFFSSHSK